MVVISMVGGGGGTRRVENKMTLSFFLFFIRGLVGDGRGGGLIADGDGIYYCVYEAF